MNTVTDTSKPQTSKAQCYRLPSLSLFNAGCMEIMKDIQTGTIDLIVTDPPYEIEDMKPYFDEMLRCLSKDGSIIACLNILNILSIIIYFSFIQHDNAYSLLMLKYSLKVYIIYYTNTIIAVFLE